MRREVFLMTPENPERVIWKQALRNQAIRNEMAEQAASLKRIISSLDTATEGVRSLAKLRQTGWAALLKRTDGQWSCVACIDMNKPPEGDIDFDLLLPLPEPDDLAEFTGF